MKLGSLGTRALLLFALVALTPLGLAVGMVLDVNRDAVLASEEQLQLAVLAEATGEARRYVQAAISDAEAVADALHLSALSPPAAGDGLDPVRAVLATRRAIEAVLFEVPDAGVRAALQKSGVAAGAVPPSTPELRRVADERGAAFVATESGRGIVVVPVPPVEGRKAPRGYVTTSIYLAPLAKALSGMATQRFARGQPALLVVDGERRCVASYGVPGLVSGADTSSLPFWKPTQGARGLGGVLPHRALDGTSMIGALQPETELGFTAAIYRPEAEAYEALTTMRKRGVLAAVLGMLLALGAGLYAARWVSRPILELVGQTRLIAARRWRELRLGAPRKDEIGELGRSLGAMASALEESEAEIARQAQLRNDLGRFLSKDLVEAIVRGEHKLALGGERAEVSVLFADVVAFTSLCESRRAEEVVALLNELFSMLTEVVFRHGGTVDKFVGDCLMAVWGAPVRHPDHAARALSAAEDMMRFLETANETFREKYGTTIQLGVGINSGEAIVGNIGSDKRMEYTVIGDVVNVAARLEAIARPNQVLVAEATKARAEDAFELSLLGERALTGRQATTQVYELVTG